MVLFIEVLQGPQQGSRYKIEHGHKIGRRRGNIPIDDEKISAEHAQFELNDQGQFILVDLESSNGILAANHKIKRLILMPGVVFRLGRTDFRVITVDTPQAQDFARVRTWRENLVEKFPVDRVHSNPLVNSVLPFSPPLMLKFIQGLQADESLLLGYGPRSAGANSLDIELRDPEAPALAFEILPTEGLAKIKNLCRDKLTLNNKFIEI
ncbi:MAG: FHA domain-containing protein, partial [Pseudobdellovibrionaceae bacterium]